MALELTTNAETALKGFFRRSDAIDQLGDLYADVLAQLEKQHIKADKPIEFVHNILDVAVQKVVEKLSWELLTVPDATLSSVGVPALLDLCITGVVRKLLINSAPYKVLEDLMEGQTISNCEKLWTLLESRKEKLTTSDFIPEAGRNTKASLCLLKMCNALLRRLSKTHNSVFCGKILVFLSFTFALSERSAVNLMGKPNVSNVTAFEDQDAFDSAEATDSAAVAEAVPAIEIDKDQHGADAGPIDYNLYRTFWDLQRYFREHELAVQSADSWEKFFDELNVVLAAFEGNAFSSDDLERTRDLLSAQQESVNAVSETADSSQSSSDHFFQPKYLTNSRLFRLQLRDPILRECMLTQFLILFNYLSKAKLPVDALTPKSKIVEMNDRVVKLLKQTPSDGEGFSEMVSRVLERERNWTKWKQEKCPPYEKHPPGSLSPKKKARLGDALSLGARPMMPKRTRQAPEGAGDSSLLEQILTESSKPSQILEKIKGDERATEVPLQNYVDRFTEAWDPENGIEEAYWPDKDKMHCWRTMRVSMKASVEHLDLAIQGAGALVRGIMKIPEKPKADAVTATITPPAEPVATTAQDDELASEPVAAVSTPTAVENGEKKVKVESSEKVVEREKVAVAKEERHESSSSTTSSSSKYSGSSARPPLKRGRSDDDRAKQEENRESGSRRPRP